MNTAQDSGAADRLHSHDYDDGNPTAERRTRMVMWLTLATMVLEIGAGWWFNSMALLADGWHMSSHALALGLAAGAYALARRQASDPRYAFGTWKIEVLAGFASAVLLLGVAALMVAGSVERLLAPQPIHYLEAMVVAMFGLAVNLGSAWLLGDDHGHAHADHHHEHGHAHDHGHGHHHDLNLRSAQLHVLTDAATSVLAIAALGAGWWLGWSWMDPLMGVVGAVLVALWSKGLIRDTARVLLDREMDHPVVAEIREVVEVDGARITDLHVWRVGRARFACAISLVAPPGLSSAEVHRRLAVHEEIVHATIELQ